ncbi:MAG TPA: CapA family protein, partial [Gemmatimonadaceae bacterium]|nr:CapA family protein [Gemmatimonadaceae bacterium]
VGLRSDRQLPAVRGSVANTGRLGANAGGGRDAGGAAPPSRPVDEHAAESASIAWSATRSRSTSHHRLTSRGVRPALRALAVLVAVATSAGAQADTLVRDSTRRATDSTRRAADSTRRTDSTRAPLRLCAGGDVTLGTNLDTVWAKAAAKRLRSDFNLSNAPDSLLAPLRPLFADADIVLVNVEGAIGAGTAPNKCGRHALNCFAFRQPVATARALRGLADSAVVVGNVANNHARDAGDDGFLVSLSHLARAGVVVTGADTLATPVATRRGDTIAVLGFYTSSDSPDARDLDAVRRHVRRAVERWGTVVVTMHLGAEGQTAQRTRDSTELFLGTIDRGNPVAFADAALESGATMVIGHGPHVLRAAEWRGDRLVLYSLGNLLTYGPFRLAEPMNRGAVACADVDSARHVRAAWLRPTMQLAPGVLVTDVTARATVLVDSLSALDFPRTGVLVGVDGVLRRRTPVDSTGVPPSSARESPGIPPAERPRASGSARHRARS